MLKGEAEDKEDGHIGISAAPIGRARTAMAERICVICNLEQAVARNAGTPFAIYVAPYG
jgi:hypothetical protein